MIIKYIFDRLMALIGLLFFGTDRTPVFVAITDNTGDTYQSKNARRSCVFYAKESRAAWTLVHDA